MYDNKIVNMATNDKVASVLSGTKDMKYNFERELEQLQDHIKETKDKIGELNKRFSNLEQATSSLANGGDFNYNLISGGGHQAQPSSQLQSASRNNL